MTDRPSVLVPVRVLEGESIPEGVPELLSTAHVVLLGYHVIPEQTAPGQARMQFEDRANEAVDDIAATFTAAGREVETRVAFTHDRDQTLDRVAAAVGATTVLLPNPVGEIDDILVPLRGAVDVDRLADLVATLLDDGTVTLWALTDGAGADDTETLLDHCAETLRERGVDPGQIRTESGPAAESPTRAVVERSGEFDVIVMGEGQDTLLTTVLGDTTDRIAEGAVAPVLVVRRGESDGTAPTESE